MNEHSTVFKTGDVILTPKALAKHSAKLNKELLDELAIGLRFKLQAKLLNKK